MNNVNGTKLKAYAACLWGAVTLFALIGTAFGKRDALTALLIIMPLWALSRIAVEAVEASVYISRCHDDDEDCK